MFVFACFIQRLFNGHFGLFEIFSHFLLCWPVPKRSPCWVSELCKASQMCTINWHTNRRELKHWLQMNLAINVNIIIIIIIMNIVINPKKSCLACKAGAVLHPQPSDTHLRVFQSRADAPLLTSSSPPPDKVPEGPATLSRKEFNPLGSSFLLIRVTHLRKTQRGTTHTRSIWRQAAKTTNCSTPLRFPRKTLLFLRTRDWWSDSVHMSVKVLVHPGLHGVVGLGQLDLF